MQEIINKILNRLITTGSTGYSKKMKIIIKKPVNKTKISAVKQARKKLKYLMLFLLLVYIATISLIWAN